MKYFLLLLFFFELLTSSAQNLDKSINRDSLFKMLIKDCPDNLKTDITEQFKSGSETTKEFILFIMSMPRSSKQLMIKNIESNQANISRLSQVYSKLVPQHYEVLIEFQPADKNFNVKESINMRITKELRGETAVLQDWNLAYNAPKLDTMLNELHWSPETLKTIKALLDDAHCISIENGESTEIGFARSGMGMYSFLIFAHNLTPKQINIYNDGCEYIYYKNNVVLKYGGGAVGSQCFPDPKDERK
jgi:hypothetical protein